MQKWPASYAGQNIIAQHHIRVILILQKFEKSCMLPNCSHLLTDFKTVFVFALGPFLPMFVFFFNGYFNGKMAKKSILGNKIKY